MKRKMAEGGSATVKEEMGGGTATVGPDTEKQNFAHVTIDYIHYVLDGITEEFCKSLDPEKIVLRLISTHHLSGDDRREINSFARLSDQVLKLHAILKSCEAPHAYMEFRYAVFEFRNDLFEHLQEVEAQYSSGGARPKRPKPPPPPAPDPKKEDDKSSSDGAKQSSSSGGNRDRQYASGPNSKQYNQHTNMQYNQHTNMQYNQFNFRKTQINVAGKCVNIEGDQTIVHGNVYNFPGNVTIFKDKAFGDRPADRKYQYPKKTGTTTDGGKFTSSTTSGWTKTDHFTSKKSDK